MGPERPLILLKSKYDNFLFDFFISNITMFLAEVLIPSIKEVVAKITLSFPWLK